MVRVKYPPLAEIMSMAGFNMVGEQEEVVAAGFPGGEEEACDFPFAGFVF